MKLCHLDFKSKTKVGLWIKPHPLYRRPLNHSMRADITMILKKEKKKNKIKKRKNNLGSLINSFLDSMLSHCWFKNSRNVKSWIINWSTLPSGKFVLGGSATNGATASSFCASRLCHWIMIDCKECCKYIYQFESYYDIIDTWRYPSYPRGYHQR